MGGSIIKKRTKVILLLLLAVLIALAWTAFNFRSYIHAFIISQTKTPEELKQMLEDKKSPGKLLENYEGITVRDLTLEEQEKLANNELTEQEAIELIVGKSSDGLLNLPDDYKSDDSQNENTDVPPPPDTSDIPAPPSESDDTPDEPDVTDIPSPPKQENNDTDVTDADNIQNDTSAPSQQPEDSDQSVQDEKLKETNEKIARLVAQLYVTKSQSNTRLKNMEAEWKAEYLKVPSKERKATNLLATYVKRAVKIVAQWEAETDAQVEEILKEVKALLAESGQDQSLVNSLKTAYEEEKTYIKAYYMGKINKWL